MNKNQHWYVLTGGPSAGKTGTLKRIAQRGYKTVPEPARVLIDNEMEKGLELAQIRSDEVAFEYRCIELKQQMDAECKPEEVVFFDRGMPDVLAYLRSLGDKPNEVHHKILTQSPYAKVFILEMGEFQTDYARTETAEQAMEIQAELEKVYVELGYQPVHVPWMDTPEIRADYVLSLLPDLPKP